MGQVFKAKVREVGTSMGILIPSDIAKEMKVKKGQTIRVSILKGNKKLLEEAFGSAKGTTKFEREHSNREF